MSAFLSIQGIKKTYGAVTAVHDVSMEIAEGEFMTFLGPSGSGKSTTLYILAGFQDPSAGDIVLNGKSLLGTPSHQRNIGMVFQRYTLFPHLSVSENVAFPLRVRKVDKAEIAERVNAALKLVRLDGFAERMPAAMSGGQQQRVALARALVYNPPLLLMDEPLSALDKKLREEIQLEIRRIHQQTGVTILYVTHDQEEALRLSDRIALFNQGSIEQIGSGQELYAHPATRFVADFIGDSNFIETDVLAVHGGKARVRLPGGSVIENVPAHSGGDMRTGTQASLLLRPERLSLSHTAVEGMLPVSVQDVTFLGNTVEVATQTETGAPLTVRLPYGHASISHLAEHQHAWLGFDSASAHVFSNPPG